MILVKGRYNKDSWPPTGSVIPLGLFVSVYQPGSGVPNIAHGNGCEWTEANALGDVIVMSAEVPSRDF